MDVSTTNTWLILGIYIIILLITIFLHFKEMLTKQILTQKYIINYCILALLTIPVAYYLIDYAKKIPKQDQNVIINHTTKINPKYNVGDIVYFKLNDQRGIVSGVYCGNPKMLVSNGEIYYEVKTKVDRSIGISTAAGSGGFFGDIKHFPPDAFAIVIVHEKELK